MFCALRMTRGRKAVEKHLRIGSQNIGFINRQLGQSARSLARALERLSTGSRLNSPADDLVGFQRVGRLKTRLNSIQAINRGLDQANSLIQVAQEALSTQSEILQQMKDIALQASSSLISASERKQMNQNLNALREEFSRIATSTQFAGRDLFNQPSTSFEFLLDERNSLSIPSINNSPQNLFRKEIATGAIGPLISGAPFGGQYELADLNGNGRAELITESFSLISIHLSNGDGSFELAKTLAPSAVSQIKIIDLNGDGKKEILSFNGSTDTLSVFTRASGLNYSLDREINLSGTGLNLNRISLGDLNGNGHLDIVGGAINGAAIFFNDGTGSFSLSETTDAIRSISSPILIGDITGNGSADLISDLGTALGTGSGNFNFSSTIALSNSRGSRLADINNNGILDFVKVAASGIEIYLGNAAGDFSSPSSIGSGVYNQVELIDLNKNGKLDLVAHNYTNSQLETFIGLGNGQFQISEVFEFPVPGGSFDAFFRMGDLNGNGFQDFYFFHDFLGVVTAFAKTANVAAVSDLHVSDAAAASRLLEILKDTDSQLKSLQSKLSTKQLRSELAQNAQLLLSESLSEAKESIRTADFAQETAELVRAQILQQAQVAALTQANAQMSVVLQLLGPFRQ